MMGMLIVGLGNPGSKYIETRHNVGFKVVESLADKWGLSWESHPKSKSEFAVLRHNHLRIFLLKPQTFMNRSGDALRMFCEFNTLNGGICVLHDDVDLELGRIKIQFGGGAGGHNGVTSVKQQVVDWDQTIRIRLGIGRPDGPKDRDIQDWVLGVFGRHEKLQVDKMVDRGVDAVEVCLRDGVEKAMNEFNGS